MESLIGRFEWDTAPLGSLAEIQPGPSGQVLRKSDQAESGVPVMTAELIEEGTCAAVPRRVIRRQVALRLSKYSLVDGDIAMVRVGASNDVGLVRPLHEGWIIGGNCIRVRPHPEVVPIFLACYLSHPVVQGWFRARTTATAMASIKADVVRSLPVAVPPIEDQLAIASVIDAFSLKIGTTRTMLKVLEEMRRAAVRDIFSTSL